MIRKIYPKNDYPLTTCLQSRDRDLPLSKKLDKKVRGKAGKKILKPLKSKKSKKRGVISRENFREGFGILGKFR
jgi:hypothetical protein